jgi:plasmid stabilization system protein ParE
VYSIHPDNCGADRSRAYEELQEFLGVVADCPDEYGVMMRDLPDWQRRQVEELFRDYPVAFAREKGLQMRVLRIVHGACKAGR